MPHHTSPAVRTARHAYAAWMLTAAALTICGSGAWREGAAPDPVEAGRIEYTTLIAGISDKDEAAKKVPTLDRVYAFPTLLFIDRTGRVRKIHTGFSGPATGDHYQQFEAEFTRTLDQLLAEP